MTAREMRQRARSAVAMLRLRFESLALVGLVGLAAGTTGCGLLDVQTQTQITENALQNPANAALIVNGAVSDFECALGAYVVGMGLLADEFESAGGAALFFDWDRRTQDPASGTYAVGNCLADQTQLGTYRPLSTARYTADNALALLSGWTDTEVPGRQGLIATAEAYGGFSRIYIGEGFCSAAFDNGPELTPAQVFAQAEEKFTAAITDATAAGNADLATAARVGRARARLNQGKFADAAADAALVPIGFVWNANYSASAFRSQNQVNNMHFRTNNMIVSAGFRNLTFDGVAEPRPQVADAGRPSADPLRRLWLTSKDPLQDSPIALATGVEAKLILAEAVGGQQAVQIINELHARVGLPQTFASTDADVIKAQIIDERRREFFADGHRAYDINRFNLPLVPPAGAVSPQGGTYGNQRCLPLPDIERLNNPNLSLGK
jgi:hypothetical protein